jgi:hypothetical protein
VLETRGDMKTVVLCGTVLWFLLIAKADPRAQAVPDLSLQEQVLLEELQHLTSTLAPRLWADWPHQFPPFLLRTRGHDILIGHPGPPDDFVPFPSERLGRRLWVRDTSDTTDSQASYPINGVMTAVMSAPTSSDNPYVWVLKAAHEVFHCYQGNARIRDPFVGKFSTYDDLSFPFPYSDPNQRAALRLEAEIVFGLVTADPGDSPSLDVQSRLLPLAWRVQRALSSEPAFQEYKLLTEWTEGVARYTERELARLAGTAGAYQPTPSFVRTFPGFGYEDVFRQEYGDTHMINPIRFVGEGVRGRVMFYYLGMGKAYALDRIHPGWRTAYRQGTLDELLERGADPLSR